MIRVFIIDDSALTRSVLQNIINSDAEIEVVGTAIDPIIAAKKIQNAKPDVITLDLEMPRMDGLTFLRKLMASSPKPVVIISGNSPRSSNNAIRALEYGALEIIEKPDISTPEKLSEVSGKICNAIKAAAEANLHNKVKENPVSRQTVDFLPAEDKPEGLEVSSRVCVIGSSTGGPDTLKEIFQNVTRKSLGFVVVQHMPALFTSSFATRLNALSGLKIKEAKTGDYVRNGQVLIIPGDKHGVLRKNGRGYFIELTDDEKVNRHRPSVDVLFESAATVLGGKATGILLTGMGDDGARGLLKLRENGAMTIAQSAQSCVVYGMPKRAIELGGAQEILSPEEIVNKLNLERA